MYALIQRSRFSGISRGCAILDEIQYVPNLFHHHGFCDGIAGRPPRDPRTVLPDWRGPVTSTAGNMVSARPSVTDSSLGRYAGI